MGTSRNYRGPDNSWKSRGYFIGDRRDYSRRSGVYNIRPNYCHSQWRRHCGYYPYPYSHCYRPGYPRCYSRYSFAFGFGFGAYPAYYYDPFYYGYPYYAASYPVYVPTPVYTSYPVSYPVSGYSTYAVDPNATSPFGGYAPTVAGTAVTEEQGGYAEAPAYSTDTYTPTEQVPATGYAAPQTDSGPGVASPEVGSTQESYFGVDSGWSEVLEPDNGATTPPARSPTVTTPAPLPSSPSVAPQEPVTAAEPQPLDEATEQEIGRLMVQGVEVFSQGDYKQAADLFGQVMSKYTDNVDAILAYGVARFATGDVTEAASAIRKGVRLAPDVANIPFDLRDRYGKKADFDQHLKALEDFVRSDPANVDGWLVLGFVRHYTGDRELASNTFDILKRRSSADTDIADMFLGARPAEGATETAGPTTSAPAGGAS